MTFSSVFVDKTSASALEPDYNEVFRYMGYSFKDRTDLNDEVRPIVHQLVPEIQKILTPQAVYVSYPLEIDGNILKFDGYEIISNELSRYLNSCSAIYLFAATLGPKIDQQIQRMQKIDPVKAVVMQATGAMFIEKYCDKVCADLKTDAAKDGFATKNRFSPGFGDVPLETQRLFFKILDCSHKIGLTLMDTLIMAPEKSVTAFVGCERPLAAEV